MPTAKKDRQLKTYKNEEELEEYKAETVSKYPKRENESQDKRNTFTMFHTEAKKEKSKDRDYFTHFNSLHSAKRRINTERRESSVLADIEKNVDMKILDADGPGSENSLQGKFGIASSSHDKSFKKLDMFQREMPIGDML